MVDFGNIKSVLKGENYRKRGWMGHWSLFLFDTVLSRKGRKKLLGY